MTRKPSLQLAERDEIILRQVGRTNRRPGLCYPAKDQRELAAECRRLKSMLVPDKRSLPEIRSCAHVASLQEGSLELAADLIRRPVSVIVTPKPDRSTRHQLSDRVQANTYHEQLVSRPPVVPHFEFFGARRACSFASCFARALASISQA
jgi:hypothetical protein